MPALTHMPPLIIFLLIFCTPAPRAPLRLPLLVGRRELVQHPPARDCRQAASLCCASIFSPPFLVPFLPYFTYADSKTGGTGLLYPKGAQASKANPMATTIIISPWPQLQHFSMATTTISSSPTPSSPHGHSHHLITTTTTISPSAQPWHLPMATTTVSLHGHHHHLLNTNTTVSPWPPPSFLHSHHQSQDEPLGEPTHHQPLPGHRAVDKRCHGGTKPTTRLELVSSSPTLS